jgi:hypothetical protein
MMYRLLDDHFQPTAAQKFKRLSRESRIRDLVNAQNIIPWPGKPVELVDDELFFEEGSDSRDDPRITGEERGSRWRDIAGNSVLVRLPVSESGEKVFPIVHYVVEKNKEKNIEMAVVKSIKQALNGVLMHAVMWDAMKRRINNLDPIEPPYFISSFSCDKDGRKTLEAPFVVSDKGWVKVGFNPDNEVVQGILSNYMVYVNRMCDNMQGDVETSFSTSSSTSSSTSFSSSCSSSSSSSSLSSRLRIWDLLEEAVEGQAAKSVSYRHHSVDSEIILTEMSKLSTIEIVNESRAVPIAFMELDQFLGNVWKGLGNIDSSTYKGKYVK